MINGLYSRDEMLASTYAVGTMRIKCPASPRCSYTGGAAAFMCLHLLVAHHWARADVTRWLVNHTHDAIGG